MNFTYQIADAQLTGRNRASRKLANNTYLIRHDNGDIAIRLHSTDVVTFHPNGTITLNSGGWLTMTTKDRMNYAAGIIVYADRGRWFVTFPNPHGGWPTRSDAASPYFDGIVLNPETRTVVNPQNGPDVAAEDRANDALRKKIRKYVALYTDEKIRELVKNAAESGTAGDCWYCGMYDTATGKSLGDGNTGHLREHMEEGYVMASLARNAVVEKGYVDPVFILNIGGRMVRDAIGLYLRKHLLVGAVVTRYVYTR